jgi:hypothetical protein
VRLIDILSLLAAAGAIVWFVWFLAKGPKERREEDRARVFFDRHGHWPDEDPPKP